MQSTLSTEDFQRFQAQLLDLREANIEANDRRLRAEARVQQLESELRDVRKAADSHNLDRTRMEEVERENKRLREKIQSTESAFQLQASTLRAECHHLTTELGRLQQIVNKPHQTQSCQTNSDMLISISVQTIDQFSDALDSDPLSSSEVSELRAALDISNTTQAMYHLANQTLGEKLSELEAVVQKDLTRLRHQVGELQSERDNLLNRLSQTQQSVEEAEDIQRDLRTQLDLQRLRGEKVHRELRRQLTRLVRSQHLEASERLSLRKSSVYSSSSSLSSAVTSAPSISIPNGDYGSIQPGMSPTPPLDSTEAKRLEVPPGFFSLADFKALIDRLSEVQEENCVFRRHIQRLERELASKSRALQLELDKCINGPSVSPTSKLDSPSSLSIANSWLSSLKSVVAPNTPHPGMSSSQQDSINRLKLMCEQLVTQNIQLTEQLEKLRIQP